MDKQLLMQWVLKRLTEKSTYNGAGLIAISTLILLGTPLIKLAAWLGIAYGVYVIVSAG